MMFFIWTGMEYNDLIARLTRIENAINGMVKTEAKIMSALTDLQAQVTANTTVEGSAVTLIQGIAKQLADAIAAGDPAALAALSTNLKTSADALAAAVAANTQAPPVPAA